MARVIIPKTTEKLMALADKVYAKHTADGASSPLNVLKDTDWNTNGSKLIAAKALHDQAKDMEKQLEKIYQNRDALLRPVDQTVRASAKLLNGIYRNSPRNLGDWGFEVNDTPAKKKDSK